MYITSTVEGRRRRLVALSETRASATNTEVSIGSSIGSRVTYRRPTRPLIALHDAFSSPRSTHGRHLRQLKRAVLLQGHHRKTPLTAKHPPLKIHSSPFIQVALIQLRQLSCFQWDGGCFFPTIQTYYELYLRKENLGTKTEETKSRPHLADKQERPHTRWIAFPHSFDIVSNVQP